MHVSHMTKNTISLILLNNDDLLCGNKKKDFGLCEHCVFGKLHRSMFLDVIHRTKGTPDYIHVDCWGPSRVESLGDHKYFVSLIDEYSRMIWVFIMKHKSDAFKNFSQWKTLMENQTGKKVKRSRANNGLEFC